MDIFYPNEKISSLFPHAMNSANEGHCIIYRSSTIRTLQQAIRVLYSVPQPILCYRQTISMMAPDKDYTFMGYIKNDPENHLFTVSFPSELYGYITRIRNSRDCRMVTYYRHPVTDFVQEIQIIPSTELGLFHSSSSPPSIRIYTQGHNDLSVSFDVYLFKPSFFTSHKIPSKL
jgi:hypothetical protein